MKKFETIYLVLGSLNYRTGELNDLATNRLDKCLELTSKHDTDYNYGIICTGGFGSNFNNTSTPHGEHLFKYLRNNGIDEDKFIDIAFSKHTVDDAVLSKEIIEKINFKAIKIITSDFHEERVRLIFGKVFPKNWVFDINPAISKMEKARKEKLTKHEARAIKQIKENGLYFN